MRAPGQRDTWAGEKLARCAYGSTMAGAAIALWSMFRLSPWTLSVGLLFLICPIAVVIVAVRENRRTQRNLCDAEGELRKRN